MGTEREVPALFKRPEFEIEHLDRNPEPAEGLAVAGYWDALERSLVGFESEADKANQIIGDNDLTPEARQRRIVPLLDAASREAGSAIDGELAKIDAALQRAKSEIEHSSRPPLPSSIESVSYEVRLQDCRRQLETLPVADRVQVVMAAAAAGDMIPILSAERSYIPLLPVDVIANARRALGEALNRPAANAVKMNQDRIELARRYSELAKAKIAQRARGLVDTAGGGR